MNTDEEVAEYFLTEGRVAMVFGSAFGYPDFLRISYATEEKILEEAVKRIKNAVSLLS